MKYLNILLSAMMLLFIAVQYNDPDGLLWGLIYLVPAAWAGLAAFQLDRVKSGRPFAVLVASVLGTLALTVYYWPTTPEFWRKDIWWETETAREGMGMMISFVVVLIAAGTIWRARKKASISS